MEFISHLYSNFTFYLNSFASVFMLTFFLIVAYFSIQLIILKNFFHKCTYNILRLKSVATNGEQCPLPHQEVGSEEQGSQKRPRPGLRLRGEALQISVLLIDQIQTECQGSRPCLKWERQVT